MSVPEKSSKPKKSGSTSTSHKISVDDTRELGALDEEVERIRGYISEKPYILTAPCVEPRYHHWSRQEQESWCHITPFFTPDEERLQYMSFLYRDHSDSCFVVRTEVDEERERKAASQRTKGISSGQSTPGSTGPKKKISLKDYKNKQAGGNSVKEESGLRQEVKASAVDGAVKGEFEDILAEADLGPPSQKSLKRLVAFPHFGK